MKISWSYRIALLYIGFVVLILTLVYKSTSQKYDLVSDDYYEQELAFQGVIDGGKNQAQLSAPIKVVLTNDEVVLTFPEDFKDQTLNGAILFYSPIDKRFDKKFEIKDHKSLLLSYPRKDFAPSNYIAKITWEAEGKKYFQQTDFVIP